MGCLHPEQRGVVENRRSRGKDSPLPSFYHSSSGLALLCPLQAMCGHQSLEELEDFLHNDPHSPPPLRVLGSLSNSQDFYRHFHCSTKVPKNPAVKCHIW